MIPNKHAYLAIATLIILCGCATGTHILTGSAHPKIKPEQVVLYQIPPAKYEIVGIVNATTSGKSQRNMDDAVDKLKDQAAEMGANGVILGNVNPGEEAGGIGMGSGFGGGHSFLGSSVAVSSSGIQLSGQAIFVK